MKKAVVILAVVLMAFTGTAKATPPLEIHRGATGLTWITNPAHAKFGTARSRSRVYARSYARLISGLKQVGFYYGALCVHGHEGSWRDPYAPFWGGMQMDYSFQKSYGLVYLRRWDTANHWPVWAQLHAAYRGWSARGWYPWPNTARYCGLL